MKASRATKTRQADNHQEGAANEVTDETLEVRLWCWGRQALAERGDGAALEQALDVRDVPYPRAARVQLALVEAVCSLLAALFLALAQAARARRLRAAHGGRTARKKHAHPRKAAQHSGAGRERHPETRAAAAPSSS